jgi:hypothetical protein
MRPTEARLDACGRKIETMDKPKQERRNDARRRRRALKGARIVFKGHNALIDCTVLNLSDWVPASKWKAPSEFRIHSILCLTTHRPRLPRDVAECYADWCCVRRLGDSPGFRVARPPALTSAAPGLCEIAQHHTRLSFICWARLRRRFDEMPSPATLAR